MNIKDLSGKRFGCLTVLDDYIRVHVKRGTNIKWHCRCRCGNELYVFSTSIQRGKWNYCNKCRPSGVRNSKLYHIYHGILQRCYNKNNPSYIKYGAIGIDVCEEWRKSYDNFKKWADSNGYSDGLTIDRIDSGIGYYPDNCRWITLSENSARANIGRHKNHTKLKSIFATSPDGVVIHITNIKRFCEENSLNYSSVNAAIRGRSKPEYHGWTFRTE